MKILLIVGVAATAISLLAAVLSLAFPPPGEDQELGDDLIGTVVTLAVFLFAVLDFIVYLSTIVFFHLWLYRAHKNLRAFDPWCRTNYSAGISVGSFFIPFVNLALPYIAIKEVWQKSRYRKTPIYLSLRLPHGFLFGGCFGSSLRLPVTFPCDCRSTKMFPRVPPHWFR